MVADAERLGGLGVFGDGGYGAVEAEGFELGKVGVYVSMGFGGEGRVWWSIMCGCCFRACQRRKVNGP